MQNSYTDSFGERKRRNYWDEPISALAAIVWSYPVGFCFVNVVLTISAAVIITIGRIDADPQTVVRDIVLGSLLFSYISIAILFCHSRWFRRRLVLILLCWFLIYSSCFITQGAFVSTLTKVYGVIFKQMRSNIDQQLTPVPR